MIENNALNIDTTKSINPFITDKKTKPPIIDQNTNQKAEISIASTDINSNKAIELEQNSTPKKKQRSSKLEAIKTFCRIRPIKGTNELFFISENDDKTLNINSANLEKLNVGNNLKLINSYKFSKVFGENSTQEEVFEYTCKPLINDLILNNKSGLVFTYGMTNAGKTFTVIGTPEKPGILPQALKNLLEYDEQKNNNNENINNNSFYCNFVEIYNEDVFDLLADDPSEKNKYFKKKLNVKENLNSVFFLQDVTYEKLDSLESFNNILNKGISKKVHSSTNLNQNSSRSHTIFKIILINNNKDISKIDFSTEELISLSVVDLAGSERQKRTDAKGKNLQEACKINQSLSTLGKCLEAMKHNSNSNIKKMVPLRESKLTKIFAEYFQGNQNIIMITNINPRTEDFEETIRALNYSCIAKDMKPVKSIIPKLSIGNELKNQLKKEKKLNEILKNSNNNIDTENKNFDENSSKFILTDKNKIYENKNEKLNDSLTLNLNELFNSNLNFDEINSNELKTEFTRPPDENTSTKDEISKLLIEIKKLREEVNEFKADNSEAKKSKKLSQQSNSKLQPSKNNVFDKKKISYLNNNINPFAGNPSNENNIGAMQNNDLDKMSFNCDESIICNDNTNLGFGQGMNNINQSNNINKMNNMNNMNNFGNMNNMLVPYGNYGYPYNNPFVPFYGSNIYNSPLLALPDPKNYNRDLNQLVITDKGNKKKKNNKNKKINDILNSAFHNLYSGLHNGINLIFINSRFRHLQNQSIEEEIDDYSDSDEEDYVPKKKKIKGTPKRKKKQNGRNKPQKYYGKTKNVTQKKKAIYPKEKKNNRNKNDDEDSVIDENEDESNSDD